MLRGQGGISPRDSLNSMEGRMSTFQLVILRMETMSAESLRVMGVNLHNVVEGGGSTDSKSEPAGVKEALIFSIFMTKSLKILK